MSSRVEKFWRFVFDIFGPISHLIEFVNCNVNFRTNSWTYGPENSWKTG